MASLTLNGQLLKLYEEAQPFPAWLLTDAETGLCLFSGAFMGINDAIHFARNTVTTTCVDVDAGKIRAMRKIYPSDWDMVVDDAWKYARAAQELGHTWDVVTVDTFLGTATSKSMLTLDLWLSIANQAVVATVPTGTAHFDVAGAEAQIMYRSSRASWLILTK